MSAEPHTLLYWVVFVLPSVLMLNSSQESLEHTISVLRQEMMYFDCALHGWYLPMVSYKFESSMLKQNRNAGHVKHLSSG